MSARALLTALVACSLATFTVACGDDGKSMRDKDASGEPVAEDDAGDGADGAASGDMDGGDTPAPEGDAAPGAEGDGGGQSACAQSCDDGVDCTTDVCEEGVCLHRLTPSACAEGSSCNPKLGCQVGKACGSAGDCADDDGCTVNERCEPTMARCVWDPLDRDGDRQAPVSCGGADCNDADRTVSPAGEEDCDGEDNNCNGTVDEDADACGAGAQCSEGACACRDGFTACGPSCADLKTSARHCGACGEDCGSGGVCVDGGCTCPAPAKMCGETCSDITSSANNCGDCGQTCASSGMGGVRRACIASACVSCGTIGQPCCRGGNACSGGATCSGEVGAAGSVCGCATGATMCGTSCAVLSESELHCGGCDQRCETGEFCNAGACTQCGRAGQPCCPFIPGGPGLCAGGLACNAQNSCAAGQSGGPGAGQ